MRIRSCATRRVLCCGVLLVLGACTVIEPGVGSPGGVAPRRFPSTVHLVLRDSSRVRLFEASMDGDTVRGVLANTAPAAVPAAEVVRWEGRRFSPLRTLAVLGGIAFVLFLSLLNSDLGPVVDLAPGPPDTANRSFPPVDRTPQARLAS